MLSKKISECVVEFKARVFMKQRKSLWKNVLGFFKGEPWGYVEIDLS